jgi:hypothetical protein
MMNPNSTNKPEVSETHPKIRPLRTRARAMNNPSKPSTKLTPPRANFAICLAALEERVLELVSAPEPDWKKLETAFGILVELRQQAAKEGEGGFPGPGSEALDGRAEQERKVKEIFAMDQP